MNNEVQKIVIKLGGVAPHYEFVSGDGHVLWFHDLPKGEQIKVLSAFAQAFESFHSVQNVKNESDVK